MPSLKLSAKPVACLYLSWMRHAYVRTAWLTLSWTGLAAALFLGFRNEGRHRHAVYVALMVPAVRLLVDPTFHQSLRDRFRKYAADIRDWSHRGVRFPYQAILALVVAPIVILNLLSNVTGGNGDSWPVLATSSSIVRDGNCEITEYLHSYYSDENREVPYCMIRVGDRLYSSYPAGMNVFGVPVCAISDALGADLSKWKARWRLEKWASAWVAGLCLGLFFAVAVRLCDPRSAAIATVFLGSGSAMLSTVGHGLWQHGGVVFWALLALVLEVRVRERPSHWATVLEGIALGMMLSCRLSAGLIVGAMGLWIGLRSLQRGLLLLVGIVLGALPWALFYAWVYGSPLGPSEAQMVGSNWGGVDFLGPVLFSPGAGLFVYQPWMALILLLPFLGSIGIRSLDDRGQLLPGWSWLCGSIVVLQVLLVAHWKCWWGGSCWGSRLCTEAMPFAALLCLRPIAYLRERRWGLALLVMLGLVSAFMHIYVNYFKDGFYRPVEDVMNWSRAPFLPKI